MTKDVLVSISGLHMAADLMESNDEAPIEVLSAGTYYFKNGKHYVFLEEVAEGKQGVIKTQIKWKDTEVLEVTKKGLSNVYMIFKKNQKNRCFYETPYGQLNLGVFTTEIATEEQENKISVRVKYTLDANNNPLTDCTIQIRVQPRDSIDFFA